jgi:beta-N-acetylhexosaminidase
VGQDVLLSVAGAETVIAVAEAFPSARRVTAGQTSGSAGLGQGAADLLAGIVQSAGDKTIVGALGNPYIGTDIPGLQSYLCTFSNTGASAKALIAAVFGEIAIQGHTPVTIPGIAKRGEGIMLPAVH